MVFASLYFLYLFLPANIILYYFWKNKTYRNVVLTLFSLIFYAWGEPVWILLLLATGTLDYLNALFIEHFRKTKWAKIGVVSSVTLNVFVLFLFKYSPFIYENINNLFHLSLKAPSYTLPIGISFYTFQSVSYVIDVYTQKVNAQRSYLKFLMFISLFHQLVAGPIVRYVHVVNEINNRKSTINDISTGIHRFCIGLFKKVAIANVAGEMVNSYMNLGGETVSVGGSWFGLIMYTVQIYFDFSGYSDMAIGLGRMFGFHYLENFNYPYIAQSITDFWRRWHISLSTWFRDYVYIPLGGNRKNQYLNLFLVWFLTGFWHGASWNFIIWGLYFGVLIFFERMFLQKFFNFIPRIFSHLYLLFAVVISWAIFYFTNMKDLIQFGKNLFGQSKIPMWNIDLTLILRENMFWLAFVFIFCMPVYKYIFEKGLANVQRKFVIPGNLIYMGVSVALLLFCTAMLVGKSYNPFIYFRF